MNEPSEPGEVESLAEAVESAADGVGGISVGEHVRTIGNDALASPMLVSAPIMISPASGIPGLSTARAVIILLAAGCDSIWLPKFIRQRKMAKSKLDTAIRWIEAPSRWIDEVTRRRLSMLVKRPLNLLTLAICIGIACAVPVLEFIPFSASLAAYAITFFGLGFVDEHGLLVAIGLAIATGVGWFVWTVAG